MDQLLKQIKVDINDSEVYRSSDLKDIALDLAIFNLFSDKDANIHISIDTIHTIADHLKSIWPSKTSLEILKILQMRLFKTLKVYQMVNKYQSKKRIKAQTLEQNELK